MKDDCKQMTRASENLVPKIREHLETLRPTIQAKYGVDDQTCTLAFARACGLATAELAKAAGMDVRELA